MSFNPFALAVGTHGGLLVGSEQKAALSACFGYQCIDVGPKEANGERTCQYTTHGGRNVFECTFSKVFGNRPVRSVWYRANGARKPGKCFSVVQTTWRRRGKDWIPTGFECEELTLASQGTARHLTMWGDWFAGDQLEETLFPKPDEKLWYRLPVEFFERKSKAFENGVFEQFATFRDRMHRITR